MKYQSPLTKFLNQHLSDERIGYFKMECYSTYRYLLDDLKTNIKEYYSDEVTLFQPPRLIRGAIEYKIERETFDGMRESFLAEIVGISLEMYKTPDKIPVLVDLIFNIIRTYEFENILDLIVSQKKDSITLQSSKEDLTTKTAKDINSILDGEDILLIPIAHGSLMAGMDLYHIYSEISGNQNSLMYPIRYSHHKMGDREPQISDREKEYIRDIAGNRPVVIFDEDSYRGTTVNTMEKHLKGIVPSNRVFQFVNNDRR